VLGCIHRVVDGVSKCIHCDVSTVHHVMVSVHRCIQCVGSGVLECIHCVVDGVVLECMHRVAGTVHYAVGGMLEFIHCVGGGMLGCIHCVVGGMFGFVLYCVCTFGVAQLRIMRQLVMMTRGRMA
jgi:hypothetical protein